MKKPLSELQKLTAFFVITVKQPVNAIQTEGQQKPAERISAI